MRFTKIYSLPYIYLYLPWKYRRLGILEEKSTWKLKGAKGSRSEVQLIWDAFDNEKADLFLDAAPRSSEVQRGHSSASRVTCFHFYRRHQVSVQVNQPIYMALSFSSSSSSSQKRTDLRNKVVYRRQPCEDIRAIFSQTIRKNRVSTIEFYSEF